MCFAIADDAETLGKLSERYQAILIIVYNLSFTVLKIRKKTALYLIVNTSSIKGGQYFYVASWIKGLPFYVVIEATRRSRLEGLTV